MSSQDFLTYGPTGLQYQVIDENIYIGARKGRNIRDRLFVINAILHEVSKDTSKNIDLEIYDVRKCFDKMCAAENSIDL